MKFTSSLLAAFMASVAYSQTIASEEAMLPACSLSCLSAAISGAGCQATDYNCQCTTQKDAITQAATPCLLKACSTSDALNVQSITNEICVIALASSSSASAAPSTSAAAGTGTSSSSTSAAAATTATGSAMPTTVASSTSTSAPSVVASGTTTSTPAAATTNAAARREIGGLVVGIAGLVAFAL